MLSSNHNGMKLKIIKRNIKGKSANFWKLNNMLLNHSWAQEQDSRKNFKIPWTEWKWKHNLSKILEHSSSSAESEIFIVEEEIPNVLM